MMLVLNLAIARTLFMTKSRVWPLLVMPALAVVLALTFTRNAWVGVSVAGTLLLMRDVRLIGLLPVVVAVFFVFAPTRVVQRFYSIFDLHDPTSRDRVAMLPGPARDRACPSGDRRRPEHGHARLAQYRDTGAV